MGMLNTVGSAPAQKADTADRTSPEAIQAAMHLQPQQQAQLQRIVLAGQKVMFDAKTHHLMLEQLQGPDPLPVKLGRGIAGLMALLWQESKRALPPNLMIPAGMVLVAYAAKFLRDAGEQVSDKDFGEAVKVMTSAMLGAAGVDPDKLTAAARPAQGAMK